MFESRDAEALERSELVQREFQREWNEHQKKSIFRYSPFLMTTAIVFLTWFDLRGQLPSHPSTRLVSQIASAVIFLSAVAWFALWLGLRFGAAQPKDLVSDQRSGARILASLACCALLAFSILEIRIWLSLFVPSLHIVTEIGWGSLAYDIFWVGFMTWINDSSGLSELRKRRRKVAMRLGLLD